MAELTEWGEAVREKVRRRYAAAALDAPRPSGCGCGSEASGCGCGTEGAGCGCGPGAACGCGGAPEELPAAGEAPRDASHQGTNCCAGETQVFGSSQYDSVARAGAPEHAVLASLGCGNPTAVADLAPGEAVLDLGSGGGLDVILSARRVGPGGKAYGLDMTDEMLAAARRNAAAAGMRNVEFLRGYIEEIPLPAETVDVVISNCVVNLSPDKGRVFAETFRVLRPGGRFAVTDVVAEGTAARDDDPERWSACIAGALSREEYRTGLLAAGFRDVEIEDSHAVEDGYVSAVIRARKPESL